MRDDLVAELRAVADDCYPSDLVAFFTEVASCVESRRQSFSVMLRLTDLELEHPSEEIRRLCGRSLNVMYMDGSSQ